jgi:hypothetical protein
MLSHVQRIDAPAHVAAVAELSLQDGTNVSAGVQRQLTSLQLRPSAHLRIRAENLKVDDLLEPLALLLVAGARHDSAKEDA